MNKPFLLIACVLLALLQATTIRAATASVADESTTASLRILSLSPHITETLFFLGAGDQVVGVTDYCNFPEEAKQKQRVGSYLNPSLETMISLEPTIAFFFPGQASIDAELAKAGIKTVGVPSDSLEDIRSGIMLVGKELGRPKAAEQVLATFDSTLQKAVAPTDPAAPLGKKPKTLILLGGPAGGQIFGIGPKTFLDELLTLCGGENWLKDAGTSYPSVSRESLIASPPDLIIEIHSVQSGEKNGTQLQENAETVWQKTLGARGKNTRVVVLADDHLMIPGPGIVESVHRLYLAIHPE